MERLIVTSLNDQIMSEINVLVAQCHTNKPVELKLELAYKLRDQSGTEDELLYYEGDQLIGYVGICCFDGVTMEVSGIVMPAYRRRGIFSKLIKEVLRIRKDRGIKRLLVLCDGRSRSGKAWMHHWYGRLEHSEYEMVYGQQESLKLDGTLGLQLARNEDAGEVNHQIRLFRRDEYLEIHPEVKPSEVPLLEEDSIVPEEALKKGMYIYFAVVDNQIIGKVHLQLSEKQGGIYGLGILPEFRKRGYGRQLLMASVKQLKTFDCSEVMLQVAILNDHALKLYKECGFVIRSEMHYYEIAEEL